jgi:hypothetical protein
MASKAHHKRILVASGVSERKPRRIIRGFERITILLKPLNKSHRLPSELPPAVEKLYTKRLQRSWLEIILVFPVVILFKVQIEAKPTTALTT